jgi:CTP:molybdopterin cytidylyltransferase MocA
VIAAVILAAGASTRMGRPKALLDAGGETFLDRLIGVLGEHCRPVIVVLGHNAEAIRMRRIAVVVRNEHWEDGQLSSLQRGLNAVPKDTPVMFTLVDHPGVQPSTVAALIDEFGRTGAAAVVPRYQGKRGHPVLCSAALAEELVALPPGSQARHTVHRPDTVYLDVDDPGVTQDIDNPEAYRRFRA